jgi:formate dehydrogenase maturation protein FdhE
MKLCKIRALMDEIEDHEKYIDEFMAQVEDHEQYDKEELQDWAAHALDLDAELAVMRKKLTPRWHYLSIPWSEFGSPQDRKLARNIAADFHRFERDRGGCCRFCKLKAFEQERLDSNH